MRLNTASQVISLARKLEEDSAQFYETLAQRNAANRDMWLSFVKENKKNITQIEMVYYGVITDALEGGFAFDMNADEYATKARITESANYSDALTMATEVEERTLKFYSVAAEQSKSLLADVPKAFSSLAKKRRERLQRLRTIA
jgi:rubrerythrin